jgi:hypothetical protein
MVKLTIEFIKVDDQSNYALVDSTLCSTKHIIIESDEFDFLEKIDLLKIVTF